MLGLKVSTTMPSLQHLVLNHHLLLILSLEKIRVYLWNVSSWLRTPFKLFKPQLHFLCQSSLGLIQILVESMCHSHGERESFKSRYIGYMQSSLLMATVGLRMVVISFFVPDSMAQDTLLGNLLKNQLKSFISA